MGSTAIDKLLHLPEDTWIEIVLALRFHAELRIRTYYWNPSRNGLPRGWTADDVVFDTIASVLDGKRTIDPERQPILDALRSIVDSKLNALVQTVEHRTTVHAQDGSSISEFYPGVADEPMCMMDDDGSFDCFLAQVSSGMAPELVPVLEAMIDGYRPADISMSLGLPVETIYVLVRRVRGHVAKNLTGRGA